MRYVKSMSDWGDKCNSLMETIHEDESSESLLNKKMLQTVQTFVEIDRAKASKVKCTIDWLQTAVIDKLKSFFDLPSIKEFQKIKTTKFLEQYDKTFSKEVKIWLNHLSKVESLKNKYHQLRQKLYKFKNTLNKKKGRKESHVKQQQELQLKIDQAYNDWKANYNLLDLAKQAYIQNMKSSGFYLEKIELERLTIFKIFSEYMVTFLQNSERSFILLLFTV